MTISCRFGLLFAALLLTGCNNQDTEALRRIAGKVHDRAEAMSGDIKTSAASSWHSIGDLGVETRVAARLRWDKELNGATIDVHSTGSGIELRGTVRTLEQRRRAMMLAETTAGVERVTDLLGVSEQ